MYLSKDLCYLELHRTGSVHILKLLEKLFQRNISINNTDLYLNINRKLLPKIYENLVPTNSFYNKNLESFSFKNLETLLHNKLYCINGNWRKK